MIYYGVECGQEQAMVKVEIVTMAMIAVPFQGQGGLPKVHLPRLAAVDDLTPYPSTRSGALRC